MKKKYLEGSFEFAEELCGKYPGVETKTFMEIYAEDSSELTLDDKKGLQQYANIACPVGLWVIAKEDLSEDHLESLNSLVDELYEKGDAKISINAVHCKSNLNKYEIKLNAMVRMETDSFKDPLTETEFIINKFSDLHLEKVFYGQFSCEDIEVIKKYLNDNLDKNLVKTIFGHKTPKGTYLLSVPYNMLNEYGPEVMSELYKETGTPFTNIMGVGKYGFKLPSRIKKSKYDNPLSGKTEFLESYYVEFSGINEEYAPQLEVCTGQCKCNMKK